MAKEENEQSAMAHVVFIPYAMTSHITPLVHIARLLAFHGLKVTIIAPPHNALLFQSSVDRDCLFWGSNISVRTIQFPSEEIGLPVGIENFIASPSMEIVGKVHYGFLLLQKPMEQMIRELNPNCIISDMFFPWTVDLAEELQIPRFSFQPGTSLHQCAWVFIRELKPYENVASDSESFLIPGLPLDIKMKASEIEDFLKGETEYRKTVEDVLQAEIRSHGIIHNTCSELEPGIAQLYEKARGVKGWHIGPVALFINNYEAENSCCDPWKGYGDCFDWLENQQSKSVLFVCFGSMIRFSDDQLKEMAVGLKAANCPTIWVLKGQDKNGFCSKRLKEMKGENMFIIEGWAPQVSILKHGAIGGFLTHCGWNSILESLSVGVPLITWPLFSDNFYTDKLLEKLGLAIGIGADVWNPGFILSCPSLSGEKIELAVKRLMNNSEESRNIRENAKLMAKKLKIATEEGGSSHAQLMGLIHEIKRCALKKSSMLSL